MLITLKPPFFKISLSPLYAPPPCVQTSLSHSCLFVLFVPAEFLDCLCEHGFRAVHWSLMELNSEYIAEDSNSAFFIPYH